MTTLFFPKRGQALAAAIFAMGPQARNGFEFEVFKADGRWGWRPTEAPKPMTQQEAKLQGRRFRPGMPDGLQTRYSPPAGVRTCELGAAVTLAGTFSTRTNAIAGARRRLGPAAKPGVDFEVEEVANPVDPERPRFAFKTPEACESGPAVPVEAEPAVVVPAEPEAAPEPPAADGKRSKLSVIVGLLTRPEGCTTKEVLEATGWPTVSMPQQARAAKLDLRKVKTAGTVTRYFGSRG